MNVIITGMTGLVASRVTAILSPDFSFIPFGRQNGVDLTNPNTIITAISKGGNAPWIFHFGAYTDVDGCEKDKPNGESGIAWKTNVLSTRTLAAIAQSSGRRMLYISTDFVFDGLQSSPYDEDDTPRPVNWYGWTKFEGEQAVRMLGRQGLIIRISFPYSGSIVGKPDFVRKIYSLLSEGKTLYAPSDQYFAPTFIDDIAYSIKSLVATGQTGIYHISGSETLTAYEAAKLIATEYCLEPSLIQSTTSREFFKNRAPRPLHAVLKHDRIMQYGIRPKSFCEGLKAIRFH